MKARRVNGPISDGNDEGRAAVMDGANEGDTAMLAPDIYGAKLTT